MKAFHELRHYPTDFKVWHREYKDIGMLAHWHNEIEFILFKGGSAEIVVSDNLYKLSEGDLIFCDKNDTHYTRSHTEDSVFEFLIFDDSILSNSYQGLFFSQNHIPADEVKKYGLDILWKNLCSLVDKEVETELPYYKEIVSSDILSFYYRVARILTNRPKFESSHDKNYKMMKEFSDVLAFIGEHYGEKITLPLLADKYGFSESYFSRIFKKYTGFGFSKYLNYVRVLNAADMIASRSYKMTEIALASGFESVRNFNRVFLSIAGCTPSQYLDNPLNRTLPVVSAYRSSDGITSSPQANPTIE